MVIMGCICNTESPEDIEARKKNRIIEKNLRQDKMSYKSTHRLLLLGGCGR